MYIIFLANKKLLFSVAIITRNKFIFTVLIIYYNIPKKK